MTSVRPNGAQTLTSPPQRRPRGIPRNAAPAFAGITALLLAEPMIAAMNILVFMNDTTDYWIVMPYFLLGSPLVTVPIFIASNSGSIGVIRLVRPAAYFVQILFLLNVLASIYALSTLDFDQSMLSAVSLFIQVVLLLPVWMMRQSIKVCRWLDPNSRPDEWEIAARNDPNDRAYRGPKSKKQGKQSPPPADHL